MATDKGTLSDIPAWAEGNGYELLANGTENNVFTFLIRKTEES